MLMMGWRVGHFLLSLNIWARLKNMDFVFVLFLCFSLLLLFFSFTIYLISDFIAGMPGRFLVSVQESDSDDDFSSDLKNLILLCAHLFRI
jgi:hypothetical protein